MDFSFEAIITIVSYLVLVTAYIVKLRGEVTFLKDSFLSVTQNHNDFTDAFNKLREDFVRLETKIEMLLKEKI